LPETGLASKPAKQNQDQNDDNHETQSAAIIIARPVERAAAIRYVIAELEAQAEWDSAD
jgi:hypothetical protein